MSGPSTPSRSFGSGVAEKAKEHSSTSGSVSNIQKARRASRRDSVLPLCMSREQQAATQASPVTQHSVGKNRKGRNSSVPAGKARSQPSLAGSQTITSTTTASSANGWSALLALSETNSELSRAMQMCSLYPTLRVGGTAFENSLSLTHRLSVESCTLPLSLRRGTEPVNGSSGELHRDDVLRSPRMSTSVLMETSLLLREVTDDGAFHDGGGGGAGGGSNNTHHRSSFVASSAAADGVARNIILNGGSKMVQVACAMKRAAMWEVVVVTALAHSAMELKFRRGRLRCVLERHLLPMLLRRKEATGSVVPKKERAPTKRSSKDITGDTAAAGDAALQGSYLRDHDTFFASLNNSVLLQSFAEVMTRRRFLPGEVIARAGQPSQKAIHFLISGKCEVMKDRPEGAADAADQNQTDGANNTAPNTPTSRDGIHANNAGRLRQGGVQDSAVSRCVREVILSGSTFGGVFGGSSAVFAETYRALSQCIVWELRAEDFKRIFRPFSDRVMLDKYKEHMRAQSLVWLQQRYQPAKVFGSVPVYRKLASRKSRYLSDFTPVVKVRGELLFAQDSPSGDVYCLLEGTVLRRTRGRAGEDGVAQRLSINSFSSLRTTGRFLLLGEEPHILPGVQPYSCSVCSRVALFYKISGENFVSALLDDPALYARLRERLMTQRQANMVLHPDCLAYVPLLQRFPPEKRAELVQFAEPRVVARSSSLCEPAQHLSELMLVVSGDVCDPRHYGQRPTMSLRVPASCEADSAGGDGNGATGGPARQANESLSNKGGKADRRRRDLGANVMNPSGVFEPEAPGTAAAQKRHTAFTSNRAGAAANGGLNLHDGREGDREAQASAPDATDIDWDFSFADAPLSSAVESKTTSNTSFNSAIVGGEMGGMTGLQRAHLAPQLTAAQQYQKFCQAAPIVYPDESEEINPPPPSQPSRGFLCALGGNWEALLLEKWPNGWETTSTVELWAIPTHKLRIIYNSCAKPTQSYILNGLRLAQKEDQQLPNIPHTKLPPMTVYTQRGEVVVAGATGTTGPAGSVKASSWSTAKSSVQRRRERKKQPGQHQQNTQRGPTSSPPFNATADASPFFCRDTEPLTASAAAATEDDGDDPFSGRRNLQLVAKENNVNISAGAKGGAGALPGASVGGRNAHRRQTSPQKSLRNGATMAPCATTNAKFTSRGYGSTTQKKMAHEAVRNLAPLLSKATGGNTDSLRRRTRKVTVSTPQTPTKAAIDPAVKAAYDGVFDSIDPLMLCIVRDPVMTPEGKGDAKASAKCAVALAGRSLPPIQSGTNGLFPATIPSIPSTTGTSSAAWPAQTPVRDRWFQAVPSYEPLPGTVRAAETLAEPPVFALNSTVLASAGIGPSNVHGRVLEGHVAYYAASLSSTMASTMKHGDTVGDVSVGVSPHPLPKRRAYAA
ncbi:hypothetical protein ABL78_4620 [Leptomonas seymouri]|uniref:Cyclic nucleotide-binding domain-containing protein n=1 Tax=Leptomonas seymouri TaxID=5684 RepID=A0A0N1I4M8_LEPSE|nr:hypothetical protein ABL78_4620 [Leptomonas seymouri]|eukprot:KPI86315.1 hypothetical protein ABL78_4620 [Leptomonas seymouri]